MKQIDIEAEDVQTFLKLWKQIDIDDDTIINVTDINTDEWSRLPSSFIYSVGHQHANGSA